MRLPKILLVDDIEFLLEMEKDLLSNTPAEIYTAYGEIGKSDEQQSEIYSYR